MRVLLCGLLLFLPDPVPAQPAVRYSLAPAPADAALVSRSVRITLTLPEDVAASAITFIMPRAIPMGYGQQPYDEFVTVTAARSRSGAFATVRRADGPRWSIATAEARDSISVIDYEVDLVAMESAILSGGDSSRAREGFISLLGYSVFAFIEGLEDRGVELAISPPGNRPAWPVFSTLAPKAPPAEGPLAVRAQDFYNLADSQILIGPGFNVSRIGASPALFLAIHAEGPVDPDVMTPLARQATDAVIAYFGTTPFPHFTLLFDYLKPLSPRHTYGFSMEHMESATFGALATAAPTAKSTERERAAFRYNVAHHFSHAWIPKRSAGFGYFPFRWELAPLIDTIWLSEGFAQYAAADALSAVLPRAPDGRPYRDVLVDSRFRDTLRDMPDFLKRMPLIELSRAASTMYSEDFRTGRTVFSRGGLMAREMDQRILGATRGAKGLRHGLAALVAWSAREKRPFRIDELPSIFKEGTGVETRDIMEHWLAGLK